MPPVQTPLTQSLATAQPRPVSQRTHDGALPPQSTSVSAPFCTWSAQFGTRQNPPVHTPLGHCVPTLHGG